MGSNPSECQIFYLFRCVLSSLLPFRSVGRSNFDNGFHNLITLIEKRHRIIIKVKLLYYKMQSTVDSYEKRHYIYIYMLGMYVCTSDILHLFRCKTRFVNNLAPM